MAERGAHREKRRRRKGGDGWDRGASIKRRSAKRLRSWSVLKLSSKHDEGMLKGMHVTYRRIHIVGQNLVAFVALVWATWWCYA